MNGILGALGLWVGGATAAVCFYRRPRLSALVAVGSLVTGGLVAIPSLFRALSGVPAERLDLPWNMPGGAFVLYLDSLSAWFLVPTLVLSVVAGIYGVGYLSPERRHAPLHFFFNLLVASMTLVLTAGNALLFLTAWEVMALSSFFLVTSDDEKASVRRAGWIYLTATHIGTACIIALFLLLGYRSGSLDFQDWTHIAALDPRSAGVFFLLALIGFGSKAGIMPFHVWLPEAHPAAPSHVSAVMSGVMIKTGIYGLIRTLTFLGDSPAWWGWLLIGLGIVSGIMGVLFALAQHDLKRLLAYHSVENIGIIVLGLGMGVLGRSLGVSWLAVLGFGGCLLHVLNHALFKGLLFLGAGSVLKAARTGEIDHMGGLLKRMPWTGATFLVGAVAISGLPPLNGFISELLLFAGGLAGIAQGGTSAALAGLSAVAGLALISGLAVACFTKAFGIVFLGEPRSEAAREAKECARTMRVAMVFLGVACAAIGLGARWVPTWLESATAVAGSMPGQTSAEVMSKAADFLTKAVLGSCLLIALCLLLALLRSRLLARRAVETAGTWDCGYAQPTNRMQYTASSFAQPVTELFKGVLGTHVSFSMAAQLFPRSAVFSSETPDPCLDPVFGRLFKSFAFAAAKMRWLQHGNIHLYVLYIGLTLLGMLFWIMD